MKPGRRRAAAVALAIGALALSVEAWLAFDAAQLQAVVAARPLPPVKGSANAEPRALRLARAVVLAEADDERALPLYHALHEDSDGHDRHDAIAQAARLNAANLLLRRAERLRDGPQPGQAIALVELAKQLLRALLRVDPNDWDARYNLERAQRLQPDTDVEDEAAADGARRAERAATTMRGYSAGLP